MKLSALIAVAVAGFAVTSLAKDDPVRAEECPAPVQAILKHYTTTGQGTLESVALDKKKKTGGPSVYEAKFVLKDGKRIEVHISPEGKVLKMEKKDPQ